MRTIIRVLAVALCVLLGTGCREREIQPPVQGILPELGALALRVQPEPEPEPPHREITLLAVGDLMVHGEQLEAAFDGAGYDFTVSFEAVAGDIAGADFAIGNLETVLGGAEIGYSDYPQFNSPDSFGEALRDAGFDFLSTANNHCMDKGLGGLLRTLDVLDELGVAHTGTYRSPAERDEVVICEVQGMRIALVSFTFSTNGIPLPQDAPWAVSMFEEDHIAEKLSAARASDADWVIALPHIGDEYVQAPHPAYVHWMDYLISCGADMVLASHPHVLQRMELRQVATADGGPREGLVIYSLGNFLSSQRYEPREISIMLTARLVREDGVTQLEEVGFIPTWVQFTDQTGARPVRVLPVYDALADLDGEGRYGLRAWDRDRLLRADREITALFLGTASAEPQREYVFYRRDA